MSQDENILISIIVPTYNRASLIGNTIKSLLEQNVDNFEIIVVDDGSTDNTKEVISSISDSRIKYVYKDNSERGATRNAGVKHARGTYVNFFDSDDLARPNHTEEALNLITKSNPEVFHLNFDIKTPDGKISAKPTKIKDINRQLINGNLLSCNGVFMRRTIALKHPFSEIRALSASEDYYLWLELASKYAITHSDVITSTIIDHEGRSVVKINEEALIARKTLMLKLCLENKAITTYYKNNLNRLKSNTYSYISLHLVLSKNKKWSKKYLGKAIKSDFKFLFTRRFLAIIKLLLRS